MAGGVEVPGAGDCERGVDTVDPVFGGGPLDQADFEGATVGIFCAVAVEGLLILVDRSLAAHTELKQFQSARILQRTKGWIDKCDFVVR